MALFELHSEITIGSRTFSGVNHVQVMRGLHGYVDSAMIKMPSMGVRSFGKLKDGRVELLPVAPDAVTTGNLFEDGDKVSIKVGYNGDMREEFRGFVKRKDLGMPLTVECEGYVRQLRLNNAINGHYKTTSAKKLLELACKGTDIRVECPVDFTLSGIKLQNADGCKIIDHIKKCSDNALTIFFKEPDLLWCGLVYTPYLAGKDVFGTGATPAPTVKYRLGWNVVKDNGLKERVPSEPVQYIINGKTVTGDTVRTESKDKTAKRRVQFLMNNVPNADDLHSFAQEKQLNANYTGYTGFLNTFLQPYALPGYNAYIEDSRYKERNGIYIIESVVMDFGQNGARRRVEVGPRLG